jgi:hypothetical protein
VTTQDEIIEEGSHLVAVHQTLAASAICLVTLAGEVGIHCSEEQGLAIVQFAQDVLRPVVENLDGQLQALREQYLAVHGEVSELEDLFSKEGE